MTTEQVVPTDEVLGKFARQQHDWFERVHKGSLDPEKVVRAVHAIIDCTIDCTIPAVGVEFELTLDFEATENDPIEMVRRDEYSSPEEWQFTGKKASGVQTRRFKLVRVGPCGNFNEVREKLAQYGEVPEGQWLQAFMAVYPKPDGNGPIGFADPSWVSPGGRAYFPCVGSDGGSRFDWVGREYGESWRWLVLASK